MSSVGPALQYMAAVAGEAWVPHRKKLCCSQKGFLRPAAAPTRGVLAAANAPAVLYAFA